MEKTPYIGELDRLISIVVLDVTKNSTGEEETTDVVISSPYAKMEDLSGDEAIEGKVVHLFNRKYTVRYNPAIKNGGTQMVLIDEGERFNISHIKEIGRKKYLEILVENNG